MTARRVLVVGGTGFLGRRIVEQFVAHGDQVTNLTRGLLPAASHDVEALGVDRHDHAALEAALAGRSFDVVVDNIAFQPEDVTSLRQALGGRAGHYLLTSSSAVYADRYTRRPLAEADADLNIRLSEDTPGPFHPRLGQAYGNGKRAAEQVLTWWSEEAPAWSALRPPVIVAADDRTRRIWWIVQRILDGGPVIVPTWGPGRLFQVAWADDVARAFVAASGQAAASGRAYNVAQAEVFTTASWVVACAEALGRPAQYVCVPEEQLALLGLAAYSLPIAGRPLGHVLLDCGALAHDVGFVPVAESTWLVDTVRRCADQPPTEDSAGYDQRSRELEAAASLA